jgi:hypothetical protein
VWTSSTLLPFLEAWGRGWGGGCQGRSLGLTTDGDAEKLLREFSTERVPPLQVPSIGHSFDPFCIMSESDGKGKGCALPPRRPKFEVIIRGIRRAIPSLPLQALVPWMKRSMTRRNVPSAQHCGSSFVTGYSLGDSCEAIERSPCGVEPSAKRACRKE